MNTEPSTEQGAWSGKTQRTTLSYCVLWLNWEMLVQHLTDLHCKDIYWPGVETVETDVSLF